MLTSSSRLRPALTPDPGVLSLFDEPVVVPDVPDVAKRDGRRTHIVDRALDYVALADQGMSSRAIARKRRKSQGYVSIALRLGRAICGMEPAELEALRSPRVTWKLAQRIVREDVDAVSIRHQLRTAVGGFSTHNVDGRRRRAAGGRRLSPDAPRGVGTGGVVATAWGWDAAAFARDPVAFVEAHLQYLASVQATIHQRAARAVAARGMDRVSVGQGIRSLQRSLAAPGAAAAAHATPIERQALAALEILERKLAEAAAEAGAALQAAHPVAAGAPPHLAATPRPRFAAPPAHRPAPPEDDIADAVAADLAD